VACGPQGDLLGNDVDLRAAEGVLSQFAVPVEPITVLLVGGVRGNELTFH
jgi:hypothetical protein